MAYIQIPIDSDRIDGDKWIIPPSQTQNDVLKLMEADSVIPDMKTLGGYCNNGGSLTPGGARIPPLLRAKVRGESRDIAAAIEIYASHRYDDCLDAEEVIEASEDEGDDEEDEPTDTRTL